MNARIAITWQQSLFSVVVSTITILGTALESAGLSNTSKTATTSQTQVWQADNGQLSPFAQVLSTLQQLQQSNPAQYQQVTGQIATNLQSAAQTAQTDGNATLANQLNQLATDFINASQSGQLPNVQDLAQAAGGHHHHHHFHPGASSDTSSTSSASASSSSGLTQLLAAFQTNAGQSQTLDPFSIITNTLASAGITNTSSTTTSST
jgi:hypothetical protein